MTHLVTAPAKDFNGVVSNQVFVNSVAEVTDKTVLWYFHEAGYTVEEIPDDPADPDQDQGGDKPLEQRKIEDLKAFASEQEPPIELGEAKLKADILAAIQAELTKRADAGDPGDGTDSAGGTGNPPVPPTA